MSETNIFEQATRLQLRFDSVRGGLSVEDLWCLPLTSKNGVSLDEVGKTIIRKLKETEEESLVVKSNPKNIELKLKLDIIKYIIEVRCQENELAKRVRENKEKKEKILAIIAQKKDEQLMGESVESLEAMLNSI